MPNERFLCEIFSVSRITIRGALKELELNGYIIRIPGKGTYILNKTSGTEILLKEPFSIFDSLKEKINNLEITVLRNEIIKPPSFILNKLKTDLERVLYIERFLSVCGEPMVLSKAYFPYDIFHTINEASIINKSFTKIVTEQFGFRILRKELVIEPDIPDKRIAMLLRIGENDKKVIQFMRSTWDIEYNSSRRIIYHEAYFHFLKGKFIFIMDNQEQ